MRIAIPTDNGQVAAHFGRCQEYSIFDVSDGKITARQKLPTPGHEPGLIPKLLHEHKAEVVIAGGMGQRAVGLFSAQNITTILGATGPVEQALTDYLAGRLKDLGGACEAHGDGYGDGNHNH